MKSFFIKDILESESQEKHRSLSNEDEMKDVVKATKDAPKCMQRRQPQKDKAKKITVTNKQSGWRKKFSALQRKSLEDSFQMQMYLSVKQREILAKEIQLSTEQVKTWYQNRRTRWRRNQVAKLSKAFWVNYSQAV